MLSVKQGDIKNLFMNCLYDLTWNWTPVSPTISQHSDHYALIYTYIKYTYLYIYIYVGVTNYTATCLPSRKLYKLDEPDKQDTAGEARTSS